MSNNTYTTLPFYVDRDESGVPVIAYDQPNDQLKVSVTGSNTITANVETITTTGTAVQLPSIACKEVTIIGLKGNGSTVYVGGSNVTTSVYGAALDQKDSITLSVSNANLIYINGNAGDGVSYVAL